jgi:phage shock protein PspC (stress-responsive transcriptional regulator)
MKKLTKNRFSKKLFGVCSGLANWLNLNVTIVRLLFVVGTIMTGSLLLWIYLILAMVLSDE